MAVDWVAWHGEYDDPGSPLSRRLDLVRGHVRHALDASPPGAVRLVSACAGQGRDVIDVLRAHPRRDDVRARLVELDPDNARVARDAAAGAGLADLVEVRVADAGVAASYAGAVPAEVVLVCGVFGNIDDHDVRATVSALPELCAPGAHVVWTRHRQAPDLTPSIREWFAGAGFDEVAFDAPDDLEIGVGLHRPAGPPAPFRPDRAYFTFRR